MFARLLTEQIEADKTYANSFNDVPASHWAANYIGYMEQFGIVTGYADRELPPRRARDPGGVCLHCLAL